jgi:hypothetical protein
MICSFERRWTVDVQGFSMLERTSRFVLEVLPYLLSALIAAVVVPGFLYSQAPGTKAPVTPNVSGRGENLLGIIRQDYAAFAPDPVRSDSSAVAAGDKGGISLR